MPSSEIEFISGIAYVSDAKDTKTLPNAPISTVIIKHHEGTPSGGTTGDYVANTVLKNIKLRISSNDMEDWDGDSPADEPAYGPNALRMFNKHKHGVADVDEFWIIDLPDAVPKNANVELSWQWNAIASINDGDRTAYDGTISISYISRDKVKGAMHVRKVIRNTHSVGTKTNDTIYLDGLDKGFRALGVLMYWEDNGTAISDAEAKLIKLTASKNSKQIWSGTLFDLRAQTQRKTRIAPTAGWMYLPLKLDFFTAQQLKFTLALTAQTALDCHYWIIQLAKVIRKSR